MIKRMIKGCPTESDAKASKRVQRRVVNPTAAVDVVASDQELARRLLGVPEDRFCAWLITLDVPADRPLTPIQRPNRRPFEEVVHCGHW